MADCRLHHACRATVCLHQKGQSNVVVVSFRTMEFANNLSHCTSHSHRNQPHTCVTRRREGKKTQTSIRRIERFRLLEKSNVVDARTWQCLCSCLEMFILVPGNVCEPRLDSTGLHYGPTCHGCHGVCARREAAPNTTDLPPRFPSALRAQN